MTVKKKEYKGRKENLPESEERVCRADERDLKQRKELREKVEKRVDSERPAVLEE